MELQIAVGVKKCHYTRSHSVYTTYSYDYAGVQLVCTTRAINKDENYAEISASFHIGFGIVQQKMTWMTLSLKSLRLLAKLSEAKKKLASV